MNNQIRLTGKFERWTVDTAEGVIYDEANNHYYLDEIRAIFFWRQLNKTLIGDQYDVAFLKNELQKRIDSVKYPSVTIDGTDKLTSINVREHTNFIKQLPCSIH